MPQMAPIMWTVLFTFFTMTLLSMMIKISFSKKETQNDGLYNNYSEEIKKLNWKW